MMSQPLLQLADYLARFIGSLLNPGSAGSLPWMFVALCVGVAFTLRKHAGSVRLAAMRRATLPRRISRVRQGARIGLALFNSTTSAVYFGSVLIPIAVISNPVSRALEQLIAKPHLAANGPVVATAATVAFYLSYEFAYWLDHYLMHRFEVLWRFHSVHHTAESLSPLTNYRVHPIDFIIAYNILAVLNGMTAGLLLFVFGGAASPYLIFGTNALILVTVGVVGTLQHSHFWIVFPKPLDRLLLAPRTTNSIIPSILRITTATTEARWRSSTGSSAR